MHPFNDTAGREWKIEINVNAVKRLREEPLKVDLTKITDGKLLGRLVDDPILLVDVLFFLCSDQCEEQGVSDEQFAKAMGGDTVAEATDAFIAELVAFFPNPRRRSLLTAAMEKLRALEEAALDMGEKNLAAIDVDALLKELSGSLSGATPESPASTPPSGP